jgi:hypothetical protein
VRLWMGVSIIVAGESQGFLGGHFRLLRGW